MKPRIHICFAALLLARLSADCQKISKTDKVLLANLQTHVQSLSADTAGGRAMGSPGEKATADYLISGLSQAGVRPKGDNNGWLQAFTIDEGRSIGNDAVFTLDDHALAVGHEWFPLALSPAGEVSGSPAIALQEKGVPWFQDLKEWLETNAGNPHYDLVAAIRAKAVSCAKKGATALILYNSSARYPDKLIFDPKDRSDPAIIPVVYITREAKRKYLPDESASVDLRLRISFTGRQLVGHNVIGFMDNAAATTVVITTRCDNSSGLSAMLELGRLLAASKLRNNNYLFVVFPGGGSGGSGGSGSGSGSGGSGSPGAEYGIAHLPIDLKKVNYLIELGRLGASGDTLNIGGFTSSSAWTAIAGSIHDKRGPALHYDSSAAQPGDHIVFYHRQIPLLVFSSGHGPADDPTNTVDYLAELQELKFIYMLIEGANARGRLVFTP